MNIVFVSNYFNHHQKPLSDALSRLAGYTFVATEPMTQERRALGWGTEEPDYVCILREDPQRAEACLAGADAVIVGTAPPERVKNAITQGKLVFRYTERPLKKGSEWGKFLPRFVKWHAQNPAGKPIYLLCASAYAAGDYARFGLFRGRAFRWGYFPEAKRYADPNALLAQKHAGTIVWAGRFLDWKHPDDAVHVAAALKGAGVDFRMKLIGRGELEQTLRQMIRDENLEDRVELTGPMKPEEVRRRMEEAEVFLFTSDRQEGWGAVLNEAMNSGCTVVASDAIGAVPYLLRHGENGCIYPSGNVDALTSHVRELLENRTLSQKLGAAAYQTITEEWNAEIAAERLIHLTEHLLAGEKCPELYPAGPCSIAPVIREDWFET